MPTCRPSLTSRRCLIASALLLLCCRSEGTGPGRAGTGGVAPHPVGGGGAGGQTPPTGQLDLDLGLTWSKVPTNTAAALWDVVWTGQRLFAVGAAGTVLSSDDGTSWRMVASGGVGLAYVQWTGTRLVALDSKGELLSSDAGASWTLRYGTPDMPVTVLGKVGSTLVALGAAEDEYWLTSTDGISWSVHEDPALASVFFANCASGPQKLACVGWRNLINVSQAAVFETSDGVTWKEVSPDFAAPPLRGAGWKGEELIAVGELGSIFLRTAGGGWVYRDSWATYDADGTKPADVATWTGARAVAAGKNLLITSDSAIPTTWRRQPVEASGSAMAFTGRRLVLVGEDGNAYVSPSIAVPVDAAVSVDAQEPPDAAADGVTDGICGAAEGEPCTTLGQTCARAGSSGCCVCDFNEACAPDPRWYCATPATAGACPHDGVPNEGSTCSPARIHCEYCYGGATPRALYCHDDPFVTGDYRWQSEKLPCN